MTGSGRSDIPIDRLAVPTTVVAVDVLLIRLGSVSVADALAVLAIVCEGVTTIVTVALEPLDRLLRLHTIVLDPLHEP